MAAINSSNADNLDRQRAADYPPPDHNPPAISSRKAPHSDVFISVATVCGGAVGAGETSSIGWNSSVASTRKHDHQRAAERLATA